MDSDANNFSTFLPHSRNIDVYSSPTTHYVISSVGSGLFRVLFFERTDDATPVNTLSDILFADPKLYNLSRISKLLRTPTRRTTKERRGYNQQGADFPDDIEALHANAVPVHQFRALALLGVIRFLKGYYLLFAMERKRVGFINGHVIYTVAATKMFSCSLDQPKSSMLVRQQEPLFSWMKWLSGGGPTINPIHDLEERYVCLFQLLDITRGDFFFSYTLDLTNTLQRSFAKVRVEENFAWNHFLTSELREAIIFDDLAVSKNKPTLERLSEDKNSLWMTDSWILPLVHGSFQQQTCVLFGKSLTLTLLARRSRFNAGTRYLKRGINEQGKVANHVEVEQILEMDDSISSFCQVRGSIPTFWSQETSISVPKPPIKQYRHDPAFMATREHFKELMTRFNGPVVIINLVRQDVESREACIGLEFADAVEILNLGLNKEDALEYYALDFKALFKQNKGEEALTQAAQKAVSRCRVFFSSSAQNGTLHVQSGTVRTNCIDNLDRTNVGQYQCGLEALKEQLQLAKVDPIDCLSGRFKETFAEMFDTLGDWIAQQYGGSQAHKKKSGVGVGEKISSELLTSIVRYYSNSFTDRAKQDAINLFLGCYVPRLFHQQQQPAEGQPPQALWDLENDFYLHNFQVTNSESMVLQTEVGTSSGDKRWWSRNPHLLQNLHVLRHLPLWDEEDSGCHVQFDRLFADSFFRPIQIAPFSSPSYLPKLPASPPTPRSKVATTRKEERAVHSKVCAHHDLPIFTQAERVAHDASAVFSSATDPALLDYMSDLMVREGDFPNIAKVQQRYATSSVMPAGNEFAGFKRGLPVSELYSPSVSGPIYRFPDLNTDVAREKELFQNSVNLKL